MYVEFGNFFYFVYIAIAVLITIGIILFLNTRTQKFRYWFIFGMIMFAFAVHFLKIFIPPYSTHVPNESILTKISLENICAVSTVAFPFLYFTKNKTLKDYMIMVGMASGILTFMFPVDAISDYFNGQQIGQKTAFSIEVIRFYTAHYIIFAAPFLMMFYKMHELSIKRAWRTPLVLIAVLFIIFINEVVMTWLGWVPRSELYNPEFRNPSFVFGIRGDLTGIGAILGILVPIVFRSNPITGEPHFWPVIWLILPTIIYGGMITLIFMFIYDHDNTVKYVNRLLKRTKEDLTEKEIEKEMS
ncbi:MAG: hypothetical protein RBT45_07750 [Acholeplasmataceae bacterium]|jgi:hypothetical protein|nr:hypothetical protein [Acholeplasmataceae bacterium]